MEILSKELLIRIRDGSEPTESECAAICAELLYQREFAEIAKEIISDIAIRNPRSTKADTLINIARKGVERMSELTVDNGTHK